MEDNIDEDGRRTKRSHAGASRLTPQSKYGKLDTLAEFILTKFCIAKGSEVKKGYINQVVADHYGTDVDQLWVGRGVSRAFGDKVKSKDRSKRDVYINLAVRTDAPVHDLEAVPMNPRGLDLDDRFIPTTVNEDEQETHSLDSAEHRPYTVQLTESEVVLLADIRKGNNYEALNGVLMMIDPDHKLLLRKMCEIIHTEVIAYSKLPRNLLARSTAEDLEKFTLQACKCQFQEELPMLTAVVLAACQRDKEGVRKTQKSVELAVTSIVAKCMGVYSNRMSAYRNIVALILDSGGMKDVYIERMAKLYDSVTPRALLPKLNRFAQRYDVQVQSWIKSGATFSIVFDNVDIFVKPRHSTKDKSNTMHHMVQALAVKDKIVSHITSKSPVCAVDDLGHEHLLPNDLDRSRVEHLMVKEILEIWRLNSEELTWLKPSDFSHRYSHNTRQKSEYVNLGVLLKNETVNEDMLYCLREYQKEVPKDSHALLVGDYLSFERAQKVLLLQGDGENSSERLDQLIPVMADFHVQMNFLKLIWRQLYMTDSGSVNGTLFQAKNLLNARNVNANPTQRYYDCGDLFDKVHIAYLVTAAKEMFSKTDIDTKDEKAAYHHAVELIRKCVDLKVPDPLTMSLARCDVCQKVFRSTKKYSDHRMKVHPGIPLTTESDRQFNHTKLIITLGLLRSIHNRSIRHGNGEDVMTLYKYMAIMFKSQGAYKYGCGLLETTIQTYALPPHLSQSLTWNRGFNMTGRKEGTIGLDQHLEHENRTFTDDIKCYRGTFSQQHIDRISKARSRTKLVMKSLDDEIQFHRGSGKSNRLLALSDINILVERYKEGMLFTEQPGRPLPSTSLMLCPGSVMSSISGSELYAWVEDRLQLASIRPTYRQFEYSSYELSSSSDDDLQWSPERGFGVIEWSSDDDFEF